MIVRNEVITPEIAAKIVGSRTRRDSCAKPADVRQPVWRLCECYGWDNSTGLLVEEGDRQDITAQSVASGTG